MFALNATIEDLDGTWLEIRCCRGVTYVPIGSLAVRRRHLATLGEVLPRLRCSACHGPPHGLALVENPAGLSGVGGPPPGWVIKLV